MTFSDYRANGLNGRKDWEIESFPSGAGRTICPNCGRTVYTGRGTEKTEKGNTAVFCSRRCKHEFQAKIRTQREIENYCPGEGYCTHGEHCENCPEADCTAEKFAFVEAYCF